MTEILFFFHISSRIFYVTSSCKYFSCKLFYYITLRVDVWIFWDHTFSAGPLWFYLNIPMTYPSSHWWLDRVFDVRSDEVEIIWWSCTIWRRIVDFLELRRVLRIHDWRSRFHFHASLHQNLRTFSNIGDIANFRMMMTTYRYFRGRHRETSWWTKGRNYTKEREYTEDSKNKKSSHALHVEREKILDTSCKQSRETRDRSPRSRSTRRVVQSRVDTHDQRTFRKDRDQKEEHEFSKRNITAILVNST